MKKTVKKGIDYVQETIDSQLEKKYFDYFEELEIYNSGYGECNLDRYKLSYEYTNK